MRYSIRRIVRNLCDNWLLYLVTAALFMLGAGLFIVCMNYRMTSRELLWESKQKSAERLYVAVELNGQSSQGYSISYDTYVRLRSDERYQDLEMLFAEQFQGGFGYYRTEEDAMMRNLETYFMNDALFEELWHMPRKDGVVYVGKEAYDTLTIVSEMREIKDDIPFFVIEGEEMYIEGDVLFAEGEAYPYEIVEDAEIPVFEDYTESMTYAVIFPLEDVHEIPYEKRSEDDNRCYSRLSYRYRNADYREDLIAGQLQEINRATSSTGYFTVQDEYKELKRQMEDYQWDMDRWMLAAVSILLLAGVGCMGAMFLLLNKRRHLIAVSIAYGSTIHREILEAVAENMIVLLLGGGIGIASWPLFRKVILYQGELRMNVTAIGILTAAALVFSTGSVLAGIHEIKVRNVAAALKEDA